MPAETQKAATPFALPDALLNSFRIHDRITRYLLEHLSDNAWRAPPPGGKGRNIAAIAVHLHHVRLMWLQAAGAPAPPAKLDPAEATRTAVLTALAESYAALEALLRPALCGNGKIKGFQPDAASFVGYLIAHEAHHRGQMTMLARQVGHPVPSPVMFGLWEWNRR